MRSNRFEHLRKVGQARRLPARSTDHARGAIGASLLMLAATVLPASGHSLEELDRELGGREKYFQTVDKETPDLVMEDGEGRPVRLADFRGKVVVLHFIYASCPDICPLHSERLAEVQKMVNQTPMRDLVQFVSITTDPERDTGRVLRDYGPVHGLDQANWIFLTSGPNRPDATRTLAERYGLSFIKTDDGIQVHGVVTHVIDRDGRWRANFHGLGFAPTNLVVFIDALANDIEKPHGHGKPGLWERLKELF